MTQLKEIMDERSKYAAKVITAYLDGDTVECNHRFQFPVRWVEVSYLHRWDFSNHEYRVIKKPRQFWLNNYDKELGEGPFLSNTFLHKSLAEATVSKNRKVSVETVHVIEVIDD